MNPEKPYQPSEEEMKKAEGTMTEKQIKGSEMRAMYEEDFDKYAKKAELTFSPEEKEAFRNSVHWNADTRHLTFSLRGKHVDMRYYEKSAWDAKETIGAYDVTIDGKALSEDTAMKMGKRYYGLALYGVHEGREAGEHRDEGMRKERGEWPLVKEVGVTKNSSAVPAFLQPDKECLEQWEKDRTKAPVLDTGNDHLVDDLLK